jgi:hypothetical protein
MKVAGTHELPSFNGVRILSVHIVIGTSAIGCAIFAVAERLSQNALHVRNVWFRVNPH